MRALALVLGAALALSACAAITERTGLTAEQQACVVPAAATYAKAAGEGWADLTYTQKGVAVANGLEAVSADCQLDPALMGKIRPYVQGALATASAFE